MKASQVFYLILKLMIISKNRAKVASENLCELNPDVIGDYLDEVSFFKHFNLSN